MKTEILIGQVKNVGDVQMKKTFTVIMISWFAVVNAPQLIPFLDRIEPSLFGIPFNFLWIWGWNIIISIYLTYCAFRVWKTPKFDVGQAKEEAKANGLEVKKI